MTCAPPGWGMKQACRALLTPPHPLAHLDARTLAQSTTLPPSPKRVRECNPPSNPENRLEGWKVVGQIPAAAGGAPRQHAKTSRTAAHTYLFIPIPVLIRLFIPGMRRGCGWFLSGPPPTGGTASELIGFPFGTHRWLLVCRGGWWWFGFGLPDQGRGGERKGGPLRGGNALTRWRWR
jgi:hypothetical protein